jgi:hypothetical protein
MTTEEHAPLPRPVSTLAVVAVFVLLSLFWLLAVRVYVPHRPPAPQNETPDNLPKEQAWRATPASRRAFLAELREKQAKQATSYAWVDRKTGVVQLPVERAMELVVKEYGGGK